MTDLVPLLLMHSLSYQPSLDVFEHFDHGDEVDPHAILPMQLVISWVCKEWRQVALSTPAMWCIFSLNVTPSRGGLQANYAREWLQRAGSLPLYIRLADENGVTPRFPSIIHVINDFAPRWRVLNLYIPHESCLLFRVPTGDVTWMLHNFAYRMPRSQIQSRREDVAFMANGDLHRSTPKPQPRRVRLSKLRPENLGFGWNELTHIVAYSLSAPEWGLILQCAPKLIEARFPLAYNVDPSTPNMTGSSNITHQTLRHLHTTLLPEIGIWDIISLPSLTSLSLEVGDDTALQRFVTPFMRRSGCDIKSWKLVIKTDSNDEEVIDFLRDQTSLTSLTLYTLDFTDNFLRTLTEITSNESFLPNLRHLIYQGELPQPWTTIQSLLTAPSQQHPDSEVLVHTPRSLKRLHFDLELYLTADNQELELFYIDEECLRTILHSVAEGVDISIKDFDGRDVVAASQTHFGM